MRPKQKFQTVAIGSGPDPYLQFFSLDHSAKTEKLTCCCEPYQELALQRTSPFHSAHLHKRLSAAPVCDFFQVLSNYIDVLSHPADSSASILTHLLNHIYKSKSTISDNDAKPEPPKDQGFTPASVLILVPTLGKAKDLIDYLVSVHCKGNTKRMTKFSRKKYSEVFNEDFDPSADAVKFGIVFDDRNLNLFSSFKKSDLILATPMSLRQGLEKGEGFDTGILCSVQICAVLGCQELLMQNWDHLEVIFENMNKIPDRDSVNNDLNRIRDEFLDGNSSKYRQLVIESEFITPQIMNLFNKNPNFRGKGRTVQRFSPPALKTTQKFKKFAVGLASEISLKRFEYFSRVWPTCKEEFRPNSILFVSCYFEFIRVKAWLEENDPGVLCLSEYTSKPDRQRALALWKKGTNQVICVTERLLHFRPIRLENVGNVLFYEIPNFCEKYFDIVEKAEESLAIYCKFDGFALQRVVGDAQAQKMI